MSAVEIMGGEGPARAGDRPWLDLPNRQIIGPGGESRRISTAHERMLELMTAAESVSDGTFFRALFGRNMDRWPLYPQQNLGAQVSMLRKYLKKLSIPVSVDRVPNGYRLGESSTAPTIGRPRRTDPVPSDEGVADKSPKSRSRFVNHEMGDPSRVLALKPDHPAMVEKRTLFPSTVVSALDTPRLLVSGHNHRKLGDRVIKGAWKGFPIFALTLEERATCPDTCSHLGDCYGNGMPLARRHVEGRDLEYRLAVELAALQDQHVSGFVVRLHILGDFYDLAYVALWRRWMDQFPSLHVFGYTAWPFPLGEVAWRAGCAIDERQQIAGLIDQMNLDFGARDGRPARWAIRFSTPRPIAGLHGQATTINRVPEARVIPEGIVCPAELGNTANCGSCGLCWAPEATHRPIVFVLHGRKVKARSDIPAAPAAVHSSAPAEAPAPAAVSSSTLPAAEAPPKPPADSSPRSPTRITDPVERKKKRDACLAEARKFIGVYVAHRGFTFFSSITVDVEVDGVTKKHCKYLGTFHAALDAALAYDVVARPLGRKTNFPDPSETPRESAHTGQADVVATDASGTSSGVQAGRDDSRSARPAVTSKAPSSPDAKSGHTLPHTLKATPRVPPSSVATSGQKRDLGPKPEFPNPAPVPVKSALPRHGSQTLSPTVRPIHPETALLVGRPPAPASAERQAEQDQIAKFLAEKGATKCPTIFLEPSQAAVPADEIDRGTALKNARLALAESERRKSLFIPPGTPVIYRAGKSRVSGVASDQFTSDPDRVAVDVTEEDGTVRTVWPLKTLVRPARTQTDKEAAE